jgi:hypothetical protein
MRFPRTMLLAMSLGLAAPVAALADVNTGAPAPETQPGAAGGAERPGAPTMNAPPHATTGVGQSPVLLNADDQRAVQHPQQNTTPSNQGQPSDSRGHYDLNEQGSAGK